MDLLPDDSDEADGYQPLWQSETRCETPPDTPPSSDVESPTMAHKISVFAEHVSKDLEMTVDHVMEGEVGSTLFRFGGETTAHGIPRIFSAMTWRGRLFWLLLTFLCASAFIFQFTLVYEKYQRNEKIVNVELVFDTADFPAITVCNLNPFKKTAAKSVPEISETLDAFHQAVTFSKDSNNYITNRDRRALKTGFNYIQYEPVLSNCECSNDPKEECVQYNSVPASNTSLCICSFDRQDGSAWPCFNATIWSHDICPECNDIGYCNLPRTNGTGTIECLCKLGHNEMNYCLIKPDRMKRMWEIRGKHIPDKGSPFREDFLEQLALLGYANMTDEVAIITKTKERLILTMAGLPQERRKSLSYGRREFIRMCSFNGQQCNIDRDFKLLVDPTFGNCFIFNARRDAKPFSSERAGPSYGLRMMVFVDASDYLPTTEASGVRIAIHDRNEFPFPDTFGYSAPTGFVSSFGLSLRKVNRLAMPFGECVLPNASLPDNYIYRDYKYEPEGCIKSCYQHTVVEQCGCADPRYPKTNDSRYCDTFNELARNCLIHQSIRFTRDFKCKCTHPCVQDVYTTTYSAARWPSGSFKVGDCALSDEQCMAYYGQNAAMLELYYEQMSYEVLTESEAYLLVNLISDVGGQLGLWMGFSVITVFELLVLGIDVFSLYFRKKCAEKKMNKNKSSRLPPPIIRTPTLKGDDLGAIKRRPVSFPSSKSDKDKENENETNNNRSIDRHSCESKLLKPLDDSGDELL